MNDYLEKKKKLPLLLQDFLSSDTPYLETERVCFMYELDEKETRILSYPIARIFIGELKLEDYPMLIFKQLKLSEQIIYGISFEINQKIFARFPDFFKNSQNLLEEWSKKKTAPLISEDEAWKKVLELEPWILEDEKEKAREEREREDEIKKQQAQLDKLPISVALEKYPALNEQLITSAHIKIKAYSEPVRPSIKNWLEDYTFTVGISNHDPIVRGNYLYKNENSLRLSATDREKLSTILKSFEEKTPLTVNVNTKQIIFSAPERKEFPKNPLVDLSNLDSNAETAEINRSPKRTETAKEPILNLKNSTNKAPEPPKKIQNQESYPQQRLAKLRQIAEPDAERLSAWRRDLPQKESPLYADKADGNIHFSSPQTFSTEKPIEKPKEAPSISRPSFPQLASITKTEPSTPKRPLPKNVVDLREE